LTEAFVARFAGRFVERFAAGFAVRVAARVARPLDFARAMPAVRLAAVAVLRAALRVVRAADRAAVIVDRAAFSAAFPMARGEVIPVICAARSASCAIPSTPAANPRPTTVAPVSMMLPTACADCSIVESLGPPVFVVSLVAISPPGAFDMNACPAVALREGGRLNNVQRLIHVRRPSSATRERLHLVRRIGPSIVRHERCPARARRILVIRIRPKLAIQLLVLRQFLSIEPHT
jgi:hypothetical protein